MNILELRGKRSENPIHVRHASLERVGKSWAWCYCPVCGASGLYTRERANTGRFTRPSDRPPDSRPSAVDWCLNCGQAFIYEEFCDDIEHPTVRWTAVNAPGSVQDFEEI